MGDYDDFHEAFTQAIYSAEVNMKRDAQLRAEEKCGYAELQFELVVEADAELEGWKAGNLLLFGYIDRQDECFVNGAFISNN